MAASRRRRLDVQPLVGITSPLVGCAVGEAIVRPHHTVLGLAPATSYRFQVRAVNASGPSDPQPIGPIRTLAPAPPPAGAPGPTGGLRVAGAPSGADGFRPRPEIRRRFPTASATPVARPWPWPIRPFGRKTGSSR